MENKNETQRERREKVEVIQDGGNLELYDFEYTSEYGSGRGWLGNYETISLDIPVLKGASMKECLSFFTFFREGVINDVRSHLTIGQRMKNIERVYLSGIKYRTTGRHTELELSLEEYVRLGGPDAIHVDRHISAVNSLEVDVMKGDQEVK